MEEENREVEGGGLTLEAEGEVFDVESSERHGVGAVGVIWIRIPPDCIFDIVMSR